MPLEELAASLREAWQAEARRRQLAPPPDGAVGELADLVARGRVVVVGEPAVTSAMLVWLELELLDRRTPGGPVPYLVSLGSFAAWDRQANESDLDGYVQAALLRDHPELAVAEGPACVAAVLLGAGLILPLLDALGDVPEPARLIERIATRPGPGPVLATRPGDLPSAVDVTVVTVAAGAIPDDRADEPGWFAALDTGSGDLDPLALPREWRDLLGLVAIAAGALLTGAGITAVFGGRYGAAATLVNALFLAIAWGMSPAPPARPMDSDRWRTDFFSDSTGTAGTAVVLYSPVVALLYFVPLMIGGGRGDEGRMFAAFGVLLLGVFWLALVAGASQVPRPHHRTRARHRRPATGAASWRAAVLSAGLPAALVFGGLGYLAGGVTGALALGGAYGVLVGSQAGLLWTRWGPVAAAHAWLALRGKLPWRLDAALDNACRRGLLVRIGAVYRRSSSAEISQGRAERSAPGA